MKMRIARAFMLVCFVVHAASADDAPLFSLAAEGEPVATIVIAQQPTRAAVFASLELQWHIQQMTGARLAIVHDQAPVAGRRILVGPSTATKELNLDADFGPQEYLIQALPQTLVLMGQDAATVSQCSFDDAGVLHQGEPAGSHQQADLPAFFEGHGTLYAVYDFLETACDVRWYAPGKIGLVYSTQPTLAVKTQKVRRAPAMAYRWILPTPLYLPTPADVVPQRDADLWRLRLRLGGDSIDVNHSFGGYHARFFNDHPEWFAQGYPKGPPQMCYTHPGFIEQVVRDARDYFDGKGAQTGAKAMGDVFGLAPMDNANYCKCDRCQKQLNAAERNNPQFTSGYASNYWHRFVNAVAREVHKTHPDKWIATLGYWQYAYYPSDVELAPNVKMMLCLHARNWWSPATAENDRKVLKDWRTHEPDRPIYLWLYYCFPALNVSGEPYNYFPGFFASTAVEQMKLWHEADVRGLFLEHSSEFGQTWLMDQLEFYVTFRLADNADLDGQQLIDEFFTRYYGNAAEPMQTLYHAIEAVYTKPENYPEHIRNSKAHNHQNKHIAWSALGTEQRMAEYAALMDKARAAAKTEIEKQRVTLFEQGIWQPMVEGYEAYNR